VLVKVHNEFLQELFFGMGEARDLLREAQKRLVVPRIEEFYRFLEVFFVQRRTVDILCFAQNSRIAQAILGHQSHLPKGLTLFQCVDLQKVSPIEVLKCETLH
jgi:hypothetical protein